MSKTDAPGEAMPSRSAGSHALLLVIITLTSTFMSITMHSFLDAWLAAKDRPVRPHAAPFTPDVPIAEIEAFRRAYTCRNEYRVRVINRDPQVFLIEGFLQPGESEYLQALALPLMRRSLVADVNTTSDVRTSSSAFLGRDPKDPVTYCIEHRAGNITGIDMDSSESLQVVRYEPGQFYKPHHDYTPRESLLGNYWGQKGQRYATLLLYMNDGMEGGSTRFPKLGIAIKPQKNAALFWYNVGLDEVEDPRTLHAGEPVEGGIKYAVNVWQRRKIPGWDSGVNPPGILDH